MQQGRGLAWRVAWGHLALVTSLAALAALYLVDARSVSLSPNNLLLVQPTALLVLALWLIIAFGCFQRTTAGEPAPGAADWAGRLRVVSLVAAFGLFIFSLDTVGYDVAVFCFVLVGVMIGGERRPLVLLLFPLCFTLAVIYGFRALVPYPFLTTIL